MSKGKQKQKTADDSSVLEELSADVDSLAERLQRVAVGVFPKGEPKASHESEVFDCAEQEGLRRVEHIGEVYKLTARHQFGSDHFVAKAKDEDSDYAVAEVSEGQGKVNVSVGVL